MHITRSVDWLDPTIQFFFSSLWQENCRSIQKVREACGLQRGNSKRDFLQKWDESILLPLKFALHVLTENIVITI